MRGIINNEKKPLKEGALTENSAGVGLFEGKHFDKIVVKLA